MRRCGAGLQLERQEAGQRETEDGLRARRRRARQTAQEAEKQRRQGRATETLFYSHRDASTQAFGEREFRTAKRRRQDFSAFDFGIWWRRVVE